MGLDGISLLDVDLSSVTIHTMGTRSTDTMSGTPRRAIVEGGASYVALERATGVTRASVMRSGRGDQSLRLDEADHESWGRAQGLRVTITLVALNGRQGSLEADLAH